jgi:hypothetical protein
VEERSPLKGRLRGGPGLALAAALSLAFSPLSLAPGRAGQERPEVSRLLLEIRGEVLGLPRYPGEDFWRGEFHLGEGDDDTNKTHAVGIVVQDGPEGSRMTIVVSRLEPARDNPQIKYAREPRTVACRFDGEAVELLRSDYAPPELGKLLAAILKAVIDKKALLKRSTLAAER